MPRRTLARLVAPLVAVACLAGGGQVSADTGEGLRSGATGPAYADLPVGPATTLPWWQRGRLHVGDTVIRTDRSAIASRSGTTVVAIDEERQGGRGAVWSRVAGDRLVPLPMEARAERLLVSANGRWVAWSEVRAPRTDAYERVERYRVVLYDARRHRVANSFRDRRLVAWEDGTNGIWLRTLSNHGRLLLHRGSDGVRVLSPRGRLVAYRGPRVDDAVTLDGWPRGTTLHQPRTGASVYGVLRRDGGFEREGRFAVPFSGLWSGTGRRYAYTDDGSGEQVHRVRSLDGTSVRLRTPHDVRYLRVVGWESADAVLLWHVDDYSDQPASRLVRCSAATGACERVPGGPRPGAPATMPSRH